MKKIIFLLTVLLSLSSCFKTDLESNSIPFSYNNDSNGDGDGEYFVMRVNFDIQNAPATNYYGKNGEHIGISPDFNKAITTSFPFCIKRFELNSASAFTGGDTISFLINNKDYTNYSLSLQNDIGDSHYVDIHFNVNDKLLFKSVSTLTGPAQISIYFGSCGY